MRKLLSLNVYVKLACEAKIIEYETEEVHAKIQIHVHV